MVWNSGAEEWFLAVQCHCLSLNIFYHLEFLSVIKNFLNEWQNLAANLVIRMIFWVNGDRLC
jgi:hypothetical protein